MAQGTKCATVNTAGCGFDSYLGKLNIFIIFPWYICKAWRSFTQHASESGERRVLTLSFPCLSCYVRDNA